MPYVVTASIRSGSRTTSMAFKTRSEAMKFANATNRDRPGSNARVKEISKREADKRGYI